jgi:spermidine synthase
MYHEALVQPALCAHPHPSRVFIGGGGEGATLREVMKHASVTRGTMCDIDEEVVALCRQHLHTHHKGSFDDARAELVFTDAKAYVETNGPWDVIVLDLADPLECGPAFALYTQEFYRTCLDKLTPHGILVTQAGPCDLTTCRDVFTPVYATLRSVFPHVFPYGIYIPSFGHEWGFVLVRISYSTTLLCIYISACFFCCALDALLHILQACKHSDEAARISSGAAAIDATLSNKFVDVDASLSAYDGQVNARCNSAEHAQLQRRA